MRRLPPQRSEERQPNVSEGTIKARRDKTFWSEAKKRLSLRERGPERERREAPITTPKPLGTNKLGLTRYESVLMWRI